jgi:hypothetical protein
MPPRPNLGPEALGQSDAAVIVIALLGVILCCALGALVLLRRRRRRRRKQALGRPQVAPAMDSESSDASPEQRLVARAEAIRRALVERFGPPWAAKTTEELAAQQELEPLLGLAQRDWLSRLLRAADRAKFGGDGQPAGHDEGWLQQSAALIEILAGPSQPQSKSPHPDKPPGAKPSRPGITTNGK